ncbi:NAD-dependent epimerase/dehydratase family protein [Chloroflexi bacterium TSY]|nr:NAD-dependent epimerase/dehydratase family protein [Chloroflexi bacterium TSY]
MNILITQGDRHFVRSLITALMPEHSLRFFASDFTEPLPDQVATFTGDPRNPEDVKRAVTNTDTIIHLTPLTLATDAPDDLTALDLATRGSFVLMNAAREAGVTRMILASTLHLFDRLPTHWQVDERWRPRPTPLLTDLCPWLAELSFRESARVGTMQVICLRFGHLVDAEQMATQTPDATWLHMADAVQGVQRALDYQNAKEPDWSIFHITAPGERAKIRLHRQASADEAFGYRPTHEFSPRESAAAVSTSTHFWRTTLAPPHPVPSRPVRNVVIYGAGGPMGSVTTQELLSSYTLRITDVRPIAELTAEAKPQAPGAPLPVPLEEPHENVVVDIRDPAQVMQSCADMDAIINCSVVRPHPADAFLVNTIGAYHVMRAAVAHGIRRIVHTGPLVQNMPSDAPVYRWDYDIHVDAPARPLDHLYIHSKYLGQEICRIFAEYYDLEVPVLLFASLVNPETADHNHPFQISWADTGRALRRALEVTSLPSPYEMVNISADLPHGRFDHAKAQQILNWAPRDDLAHLWQD